MQIGQNLRPASNTKSIAFRQENSLTDDQWIVLCYFEIYNSTEIIAKQ